MENDQAGLGRQPKATPSISNQDACASCGACCNLHGVTDQQISFAFKHGDDQSRLPVRLVRRALDAQRIPGSKAPVKLLPGFEFPIWPDKLGRNKCMYHFGHVGSSSRCLIYDQRPQMCREVPPGDPLCVWARSLHGLGAVRGGFGIFIRKANEGEGGALSEERLSELEAGAEPTDEEWNMARRARPWGMDWLRWARDMEFGFQRGAYDRPPYGMAGAGPSAPNPRPRWPRVKRKNRLKVSRWRRRC